MSELGRLKTQGVEQLQMPGSAGKPLFGPHYVADLHDMVVGHHRQVVRGEAVGLEDDKVFLQVVLPFHVAADQIVDPGNSLGGHPKPNHRRAGCSFGIAPLLLGHLPALAGMAGGEPLLAALPPHLFQLLPAAIATVSAALIDELSRQILVDA